ncbi:YopX family protein [Neobacillus vireti]|uniref:YopX family protein n=1 Tax=Neobacillus vireti TaxID=220686 RepID=UPI002FFE3CE7
MRVFKFRAWDDNKMYYQVRCGGIFDDIPTAPTTWSEKHGDWVNLTGQPYTKIMQFTGLKDKNGNEIYEGDIVKGKAYEFNKCPQIIGEVIYDYCEFKVKAQRDNSKMKAELNTTYEVIGNVFENPELIIQ